MNPNFLLFGCFVLLFTTACTQVHSRARSPKQSVVGRVCTNG